MHNSAAPTSATATCSPTAPAVSAAAIEPAQRRRAIVATVIGNGLEWFDFTVYSFFAIIIAKLFFPTGNDLSSLLLAVATFGVGFFMRPVGGIVLGIYATVSAARRHCR